jgi:hypothetical protein
MASRIHYAAAVTLTAVAATVFAIFINGCDSGALIRPFPARPITGMWGGDGIRLTAGPEGADLLYDCAEGSIEGSIIPDRKRRFDIEGMFVPTPGPEPEEGRKGYAARHQGTICGTTMVLKVTLIETGQSVGIFELTLGEEGRVVFCR